MTYNCSIITLISVLLLSTNSETISEDPFNIYCNKPFSAKVKPNTSDGLWDTNDKAKLFIAGNHCSYIDKFKKDFPQLREGSPQRVDNDIRSQTATYKRTINYQFREEVYGVKNVNSKRLYLMGFNHIWFGCPQMICVDSGIDAIAISDTKEKLVFRGKYLWKVDTNKTTNTFSNPINISDQFRDVPTHLDAVTRIGNKTLFFLGEYVWIISQDKSVDKQRLENVFHNLKGGIDCALFINNTQIYIFRGTQYWMYTSGNESFTLKPGFPKPVSNLHVKFPNNLNSCYFDPWSQKAYFFIRWTFISLTAQSISSNAVKKSDLSAKYSFVEFFGCDRSQYKQLGFGSYQKFLDIYGRQSVYVPYESTDPFNPNEVMSGVTKEMPFLVIIIIIFIMFLSLLSFTVIGYIKSKASTMSRFQTSSKSLKGTKSTIRDLPSRDVQSIVIESTELKPVKHSTFVWKPKTGQKQEKHEMQDKDKHLQKKKKKIHKKKKEIKETNNTNIKPIYKTNDDQRKVVK